MPADQLFSLTMMGCMKVSGLQQLVPELQTAKAQGIKWIACVVNKPRSDPGGGSQNPGEISIVLNIRFTDCSIYVYLSL